MTPGTRGHIIGWASRTRHGAWAHALREFDHALAVPPGRAPSFFERGLIRANVRHDFAGAEADFGCVLELEPDWLEARLVRARCRAQAGRWPEAVADAGAVLAVEPWNLDARMIRGGALQRLGRHREALTDFDQAATLYPHYLSLYRSRAASLRALGDERGAAAVDSRCAELFAEHLETDLQANSEAWRLATGKASSATPRPPRRWRAARWRPARNNS